MAKNSVTALPDKRRKYIRTPTNEIRGITATPLTRPFHVSCAEEQHTAKGYPGSPLGPRQGLFAHELDVHARMNLRIPRGWQPTTEGWVCPECVQRINLARWAA